MTDDHDAAPAAATEPTGPDPAPQRRTLGRDLLAAGVLAVVLTAIGFPFAMLWQIITPRVEYVTVEGGWVPAEVHSDHYVLADLYFSGLGLLLGVAVAILAWTAMPARRGPAVLAGLVIGSVACQVVAWRIGRHEWESFWAAVEHAPAGLHMWRPPAVLFVELDTGAAWRAITAGDVATALEHLQLGALAVMALAAAFAYTVCAGWSRRSSLRSGVPE